jgi:hypothetical protein
MKMKEAPSLNIIDLIKCQYYEAENYYMITATPACGILYITKSTPYFISGQLRMRSTGGGKYPTRYIEMLDTIFGTCSNTIEVCSNSVSNKNCFTVDINPAHNPSCVDDAEILSKIPSNSFERYRADPPYNQRTAREMFQTDLPNIGKMLKAACRVVKAGSLVILLLGNVNRQAAPIGLKRIGWIPISCIPSNEIRAIHLYYKLPLRDNACDVILDKKSASDGSFTYAAGGDLQ